MRRVSRRPELPMAPVQIPHVLEPPVQIPHVPDPVQIPVSQVPQPPVCRFQMFQTLCRFHMSQNHLCRFYMSQNLCRFYMSQKLCRFPQSSTLWTLWCRWMHSTRSCRTYLDTQPKNSSCFSRVTYYEPEYPYTIFFEPNFGVNVPRSFGKSVIVFTSHLDLRGDTGVDLKFFVGRSPSCQVWEAYQPQNTEAYPLDLTHCTRLAHVYVTWLTWLDDWEMHRDENLPWHVVCPKPWKRALETHVERSHQNALDHAL
ncbi:uncharacterized protein TNCV_541231 [Trichonephila clavipes]|nr:uncharacterized protein TNCV_541231 [Trichonephila clavipes]